MRVLIAPDSFKGSSSATEVAATIARGWSNERPDDDLTLLPLGDGGEGTLDAVATAIPDARRHSVLGVTGPGGGRVDAEYLELPDKTSVIELASSSGLPLLPHLAPLEATTRGLGEVIAAALDAGAERLVITLGGSASTDGGLGALRALGLEALDGDGEPVADGGIGLARIARFDTRQLRPPPPRGVEALTDVSNPLLGPRGAAAVFGPQKGASPIEVAQLDAALTHLASQAGGDPEAAGAGAAGGTAYGLATFWSASLQLGSEAIGRLIGLPTKLAKADLVITGEGTFDMTSLSGKAAGYAVSLARSANIPIVVIAGSVDPETRHTNLDSISLSELASSREASMAEPKRWLEEAGAKLARRYL